ncbi:hypothetical protein NEOLEDRAFT_1246057 [Neolentinus lepideus HHB14362 ss-1]|uniref:F-box domain-containing protein n=1 Tax=Neolentinus lepideus HHB14362 ss-1 TaxID=1314782 RepID=A0A165N2U7_9AGAM|nr:hypothetical protein NEOLEDRAFT_1246057 [Neolentinus lepideus HHB14362 ss-1]
MSNSARSGFCALAIELMTLILSELDLKLLLQMRTVCKSLKSLVDESIALQYKVELAAAGMEDNHKSPLVMSERMSRLQQYTLAWQNLDFHTIELPPQPLSTWELVGGVLGSIAPKDSRMIFNRLPGHSRGIERKEWQFACTPIFPVRDFTFDPAQDLLVAIESPDKDSSHPNARPFCRLHVKTLSTGNPHPLAVSPVIDLPAWQYYDSGLHVEDLKIHAENFGLLLRYHFTDDGAETPFNDLVVVNWKTSDVILHLHRIYPLVTYTFLTEQYVALAISDGRARLEVHSLSKGYEASQTTWDRNSYLCAFDYPFPSPRPNYMFIQSDHASAHVSNNSPEVPFFAAESVKILSVYFTYQYSRNRPVEDERHLSHLIPIECLLALIPHSPDGVGTTWLWKYWAVQNSLTLNTCPDICWPSYVSGSKYADYIPKTHFNDAHVEVFDLNPVLARRESAKPSPGRSEKVQYGLRHLCYFADLPDPPGPEFKQSIMISDDGLVLVDFTGDGSRDTDLMKITFLSL